MHATSAAAELKKGYVRLNLQLFILMFCVRLTEPAFIRTHMHVNLSYLTTVFNVPNVSITYPSRESVPTSCHPLYGFNVSSILNSI